MAATHGSESTIPSIALPAPTASPMALSLGVTLLFAGLLTHMAISILGAIVMLAAAVGWFREVLPHEQHEAVPLEPEPPPVGAVQRQVARLEVGEFEHRARLPIETYPVSAGLKGGLAGSVAMAVLAILYGLIFYRSPWYPINLLAGAVYGQGTSASTEVLAAFHVTPFVIASAIHLVTSALVGLLYGVMLPMFPRRPILLGGLIAPLMWTGLIYATLDVLNPIMNERIDWRWFVASQFAFGIVAGLVVARHTPIRTLQFMPFSVRAGFEAGGMGHEPDEEGPKR
jgi:hypothetical protein